MAEAAATAQAQPAVVAAAEPDHPPPDLAPDFWQREGPTGQEPPAAEAATGDGAERTPWSDPVPSGTAETDSEDDDALGGEAEEDAFAALRRLFPGRILAVEPIETSDDAPTDGSSASLPLGSDRSDEAMPHDGEAGLAEVE